MCRSTLFNATPTTFAVLHETAFTKNPAYEAILAADKALGQGSWVPGLTEGKQYPEGATFVEIIDLAAVVPWTKVEQALDDARTRGLTTTDAVYRRFRALAKRGRPGISVIRSSVHSSSGRSQ